MTQWIKIPQDYIQHFADCICSGCDWDAKTTPSKWYSIVTQYIHISVGALQFEDFVGDWIILKGQQMFCNIIFQGAVS